MTDPAQVKQEIAAAIDKALVEVAQMFEAESNKIVPYEKGDLQRSSVSGLIRPGMAGVGYRDGGAVAAHEKLNVRPANGKQRKYLESTLQNHQAEALAIIERHVRPLLS